VQIDRRFGAARILVSGAFLFAAAIPAAAQTYTVTRLAPAGATRTSATAINNAGQVIGRFQNATGESRIFLYRDGTMQELETFGGTMSHAYRINQSGEIVGFSQTASGDYRAFRYAGGGLKALQTFGGGFSAAMGINRFGQVVAYSQLPGEHVTHGVFDDGTTAFDLGTLDGARIDVVDINDAGHVIGHRYPDHHGGFRHAFVYDGTEVNLLGSFGGDTTTATDVNELAQIVGYSATATGEIRAFLYDGGVMRGLGLLPGGTQSLAYGIDNLGRIVGAADSDGTGLQAVLYSGGLILNLNTLIPTGSGWVLVAARAINDQGQIVGDGIIDGKEQAFLLTPVQ
jgi:probable HAF family extracellular repeat protein